MELSNRYLESLPPPPSLPLPRICPLLQTQNILQISRLADTLHGLKTPPAQLKSTLSSNLDHSRRGHNSLTHRSTRRVSIILNSVRVSFKMAGIVKLVPESVAGHAERVTSILNVAFYWTNSIEAC